jgi:hypothetical protein
MSKVEIVLIIVGLIFVLLWPFLLLSNGYEPCWTRTTNVFDPQ